MKTFVVLLLLVIMFVFAPLAQRAGAEAAAPALAVHEVEGVRFAVPENWTAIRDLPGEKMFHSPDRRMHLMAFWWYPNEPITGYDDIVSVRDGVLDDEPVMLISSDFVERVALQSVSKRARMDGCRFILTLETEGASRVALSQLYEKIATSLRWGDAFGRLPGGNE